MLKVTWEGNQIAGIESLEDGIALEQIVDAHLGRSLLFKPSLLQYLFNHRLHINVVWDILRANALNRIVQV